MTNDVVKAVLEQWGAWGLALMIVALIVLAAFINYISRLSIRNIFKSKKSKKNTSGDISLLDSWFFSNAMFKLRFDIPTLNLNPENSAINQVYIDLIYINVESFYYGCKRILETHDMATLSGREWEHLMKVEICSMMNRVRDKAEDHKVPQVVIHKYSRWMKPYINLLNTNIEQLGGSAMYGPTSSLRMHVFLLVMNLLIIVMIGDLEKLASEHDPDFEGVTYRDSELY